MAQKTLISAFWLLTAKKHTHTYKHIALIYQSGNETNFVDECLLFRKFHVAFNRQEILAVLVYCGMFHGRKKSVINTAANYTHTHTLYTWR